MALDESSDRTTLPTASRRAITEGRAVADPELAPHTIRIAERSSLELDAHGSVVVVVVRPGRSPCSPQHRGSGLRWIVEATNTWWSNYGQLRRNTDRRSAHRHAALCLATTILMVGRLIDWRDRWSPE